MKLSRRHLSIDIKKLKGYLLNLLHPDGGSKAKLLMEFGFNSGDYITLKNAILNHAAKNDINKIVTTEFAEKYMVEGHLETPSKRRLIVRSIWAKELRGKKIKFVTLYPI
jgi:hypothetical protein